MKRYLISSSGRFAVSGRKAQKKMAFVRLPIYAKGEWVFIILLRG